MVTLLPTTNYEFSWFLIDVRSFYGYQNKEPLA